MKKIFIKSALIFLFILPLTIQTAKAGMGSGPPKPCGGAFPPCAVPLDGGISLLLIAGAAYGGKKIINTSKKNLE